MNKWMNKWINAYMNKWINEQMTDYTYAYCIYTVYPNSVHQPGTSMAWPKVLCLGLVSCLSWVLIRSMGDLLSLLCLVAIWLGKMMIKPAKFHKSSAVQAKKGPNFSHMLLRPHSFATWAQPKWNWISQFIRYLMVDDGTTGGSF